MTKVIISYIEGIEKLCKFYELEYVNTEIDETPLGYLIGVRIKKNEKFLGYLQLIKKSEKNLKKLLYDFETKLREELQGDLL